MKQKHLEAYMDTAIRFSQCSTAKRLKVGCIAVKDNKIISIGYNGTPNGSESDEVIADQVSRPLNQIVNPPLQEQSSNDDESDDESDFELGPRRVPQPYLREESSEEDGDEIPQRIESHQHTIDEDESDDEPLPRRVPQLYRREESSEEDEDEIPQRIESHQHTIDGDESDDEPQQPIAIRRRVPQPLNQIVNPPPQEESSEEDEDEILQRAIQLHRN
jgi:hypothetical protein